MTPAELIAALEKADAASRELDAHILSLVKYPHLNPQRNFFYTNSDEWGVFESNQPHPGMTFHDAPHYTASADAAMSIVPEGWRLDLFQDGDSKWHAGVRVDGIEVGTDQPYNSAALAICIAALKARSGL